MRTLFSGNGWKAVKSSRAGMTMPQKDEPGYSAYDGCAEAGRGQTT